MLKKKLFSIIVYYRILNIVPNRTLLFIHSIHNILHMLVSAVQSLSHVWLFATPGTAACQASLSITNSQSLLKLMSIESVMPYNHLILCHPLLLLPSIFPSIRVFSNESVLHIRFPEASGPVIKDRLTGEKHTDSLEPMYLLHSWERPRKIEWLPKMV